MTARSWIMLTGVLMLSACAGLPGHIKTPAVDATPATWLPPGSGAWPSAHWWSDFHDARLQSWIERAQKRAPAMLVAAARLDEASAGSRLAKADRGASVALDSSVTRERFSANSYIPPPFGGQFYDDGELAANFHYDFDFWGQQRHALKAALGEVRARTYELQGQADWIAARVVSTYISLQVVQQRIELLQQRQKLQSALRDLQERQIAAGLLAADALSPVRQDLLHLTQDVQEAQAQRDQWTIDLQQWVDLPLTQLQVTPRPLPTLLQTVPAHLGLDLLARRSDLAAARARVEVAAERAKVARAAFYPDVNLSAFAGWSSLLLSRWIDQSSMTMGVAPALHLPIFDAGRLRAHLDQAKAALVSADASYREVLLRAIREVETAQVQAAAADQQRAQIALRLAQAQRHGERLRQRQAAGLSDARAVLVNQLQQSDLIELDEHWLQEQLLAQVAMVEALGGGFATTAPSCCAAPTTARKSHD